MKCQKCGKNEVNFHYSSNVNGRVTEAHLCSHCAQADGYDINSMFGANGLFDFSDIFSDFYPIFGGGFIPAIAPMPGYGKVAYPRIARIGAFKPAQPSECGCGCSADSRPENSSEIKADDDMAKRRELNMQLQAAIKNEEFEKAAEIRDRIKSINGDRG